MDQSVQVEAATISGSSQQCPWLSLLVCSAVHLHFCETSGTFSALCVELSVLSGLFWLCVQGWEWAGFGSQICWPVAPGCRDT